MAWVMNVEGLDNLRGKLQRAEQASGPIMAEVLTTRLQEAVRYAHTRYLTGGTTADRLANRTGALRRSFDAELLTSGTAGTVSARIGYIRPQTTRAGADPLVYAAVHEGWPDNRSSTTIRPRHAKYLAMPLKAAMTPAGVAKGNPRDFDNTFVQRSKAGNLLIFQRTAKGIVPLFVLRSEVTIPARPALRPTMQRFLPLIVKDVGERLRQVMKG
jgi:hypothetical protein